MVQWKMSCQLIEELPVAAGRSVVTEAMCVNLLPCHFFCLASRLPFISTYFSFPFLPHLLPLGLHSLYLVLCDKLLLAVDLLLVKSASFASMKVGCAGGVNTSPPPCSTCLHLQSLAHSPTSHTCHKPNVEMSLWKLIFCLIRSHQIRFCPCLISSWPSLFGYFLTSVSCRSVCYLWRCKWRGRSSRKKKKKTGVIKTLWEKCKCQYDSMTSQHQPITKKAVSLWRISLVYRISSLRDYWIIVQLFFGVFFFFTFVNSGIENCFQSTGGVSDAWFAFRRLTFYGGSSLHWVCVRWCVVCGDSCLNRGNFTPSSAVYSIEKNLISFHDHLLLYSLTVFLFCCFLFCKSNRISEFLLTLAIQKRDCLVPLHQNRVEIIAINLCWKVWNHLVSVSLGWKRG